jgi:hypothetical protein
MLVDMKDALPIGDTITQAGAARRIGVSSRRVNNLIRAGALATHETADRLRLLAVSDVEQVRQARVARLARLTASKAAQRSA